MTRRLRSLRVEQSFIDALDMKVKEKRSDLKPLIGKGSDKISRQDIMIDLAPIIGYRIIRKNKKWDFKIF